MDRAEGERRGTAKAAAPPEGVGDIPMPSHYPLDNRNTVIPINSNSKMHVIFTSTAELMLIRITVMEKTQMDHIVSEKMHILELAAASPPPPL